MTPSPQLAGVAMPLMRKYPAGLSECDTGSRGSDSLSFIHREPKLRCFVANEKVEDLESVNGCHFLTRLPSPATIQLEFAVEKARRTRFSLPHALLLILLRVTSPLVVDNLDVKLRVLITKEFGRAIGIGR